MTEVKKTQKDFKIKTLLEIIDTTNQINILQNMKLEDVKIGQRFKFTKNGLIYIKDTEQGMNNRSSYSHTEKLIKTRGYGYLKSRNKLTEQNTEIFEILPAIKKVGGKREGSGAKPKYNEKTKTFGVRCPTSKINELKLIIKAKLSEWVIK